MRIHRLIAILMLLESRGRMKARDLALVLETSERTIHRDITTLCETGIPIAAVAGPSGGFELMAGYTGHLHQLQHDEAVSLFLSGIGVQPHQDTEAHSSLMTALAKLEVSLPEQYRSDVRIARQRFLFDPTTWWDDLLIPANLDVMRQSVWQSQKLRITYRKPGGETSTRVVHPYGMVVKVMIWYLVAYCEKRHGLRTFKCDRVDKAAMMDEGFTIPDDFQLADYWKASAATFKEVFMSVSENE